MAAAPSCTSYGLRRHASITKIICATSISPALESTRVGKRDLLIPSGFSNAAPGRRQSIQWQALPYTTLTFSRNQTSTSRVRSPAGKCTRLITARPAAYLVSIGKRCGSQPVLVPKIEGYARLLPTLRGGRELRKL